LARLQQFHQFQLALEERLALLAFLAALIVLGVLVEAQPYQIRLVGLTPQAVAAAEVHSLIAQPAP
jgi:hypothetical protein